MKGLQRRIATGAVWMVLFKLLDRSLGLVSMIILARILVPADFGLVAMATSLIGILELLGAFGVDVALIQRANATREHFDTAWTLNLLASTTIATLVVLLSWPLSKFYGDPRLVPLVCTLAAGSLAIGFENVGVIAFRKELDFQREFRYLMTKRVLLFCISVPLALWLRSYWALALGTIFGRYAGVAISYLLHPFRPRFSLVHAKQVMRVSGWLVAQNALFFVRERAGDLLLGRISGAHSVGILSLSNEIASMPGSELVAPINRAALPGYAKVSDDRAALLREYRGVAGLVATLVIPVVAGVAIMAPIAVALLLGPRWHEAGVVIELLAFIGISNVLLGTAQAPVLAIGRQSVFAKIFAVQIVVLIPLLLLLIPRYGVIGAAMSYVAITAGLLPINLTLVLRTLQLPVLDYLASVWRPLVAAALMYLATRAAMPALDAATMRPEQALTLLAAYVPLGAGIYLAVLSGLWWACGRPEGAETSLLRELVARVSQARARLFG
jgi:lipopolysaccharide exporter